MKTTKFAKNLLCLTLVVLAASMQIACSKDKKSSAANNGYYNNGQCYNQQYGQQQYGYNQQYQNQQYSNQYCGSNGGNGQVLQQTCYGNYSTPQGQYGTCYGSNCAGYLLYDQYGQAVQCI